MTSRRVAARFDLVVGLVLAGSGARFQPQPVRGRQSAAPVLSERQRVEALVAPETFFGFRMGADRKLANWDKLVFNARLKTPPASPDPAR